MWQRILAQQETSIHDKFIPATFRAFTNKEPLIITIKGSSDAADRGPAVLACACTRYAQAHSVHPCTARTGLHGKEAAIG